MNTKTKQQFHDLVRFDQNNMLAHLPVLFVSPNGSPAVAIAGHVLKHAKRLKRGSWYVEMASDERSGRIAFHKDDRTIPFTIEARNG
ncbi:hypothetical protein ACMX2H_16010 [Arthrobacter sulfonylureivorans]|uniref:hypothetical protein n=1 Tax=Arthrobacter sulfonylureivorans TaxID=2486855 RepID=UPI0039E4F32A